MNVNGSSMQEVPNKVITIDQLDEMFNNIKEQAQWDVTKPLLWGYFFTDSNPEKLEAISPKLQEMGYKIVDIFQAEKEEPSEPDLFYLHVEKVEIHDSQSLDKRNDEFYIFSSKEGIGSYDGMDVGPVND